ncbi:hypothetical protein FRC01_010119 [Tulasnella sp. 417]|nr:hypothetical protein FRC01_010119 [Tulasnella sp. 417]
MASVSQFLRPQVVVFALVSLLLLYLITKPASVSTTQWKDSWGETVTDEQSQQPPAPAGGKCSPADWSAGAWRRKNNATVVAKSDDVYAASGFDGCVSNREVGWHLSSDHPEHFSWRGNVSAYEWVPAATCDDMKNDFRDSLVVDLVERGGWLLIGDSVTEQHFFSISCTLYPHVIATPDYSKSWDWDRAWAQHLHLNPDSPLVSRIKFPNGFNITQTPLVTFRRNDLLFNLTEIETMFTGGGWRPGPGENTTLFGTEPRWTISIADYLNDLFFRPLPEGNYHALIVNTAAHWSLGLFSGLNGFTGILDLFRVVMANFVYQAGRQLDLHQHDGRRREVVVRDYLTGNENCHSPETMLVVR